MEASWEVLAVPPEIEHSTTRKTSMTDDPKTTQEPLDKTKKPSSLPKLCGFLNKQGEKGLIKSWKTRWFVHDERRCRLYYYRTPQDCVPLGSIDLANATFSFEVDPTADKLNKFDICTTTRDYHLQAKDKQTMMFWLQELQARRREYSKKRTQMAVQKRQDVSSVLLPTKGLLGGEQNDEDIDETTDISESQPQQVMQVVPAPETVGEEAALKSPAGGGMFNLSFNNIKTEIKNMSVKRFSVHMPNTSMNFSSPIPEEENNDDPSTSTQSAPNLDIAGKASTLRRKFSTKATSESGSSKCQECEKLQSSLEAAEGDLVSAREDVNVRQEVILNLHELLRRFQLEKADSLQSDQKKLEDELQNKKDYIRKLEGQVGLLKEEQEQLQKRKDEQLMELMEQIQMYKEMTAVKDQVVVSLTNQLHNMEIGFEENPESPTVRDTASSTIEEIQEVGKLKESLQAYVLQNRFLNSEILELNRLRQDDEERLRAITVKHATVEAEMCKYKSKYFLVLREFQRPKHDRDEDIGGPDEDIINQLLQDAMDNEALDRATMSRTVIEPYDRWGFLQKLDKQDEESFLSMANQLDRRSGEIMANRENLEISNGVKWENYIVAHQNREFQITAELKSLIRAGIPDEYRGMIWRQCINHRAREIKGIAGERYYSNLLESIEGKFSPAAKQIELDLLRTLPNNKYYDKADKEGVGKLRRVLLAYSWHNPYVGYCQGLNRLVAIAMLYLTEEEAFWCLVAIVEKIMPKDYYSRTLLAAQVDQRVLRDLMSVKMPRLYNLFENLRVDLSLIAFNWFLTVFVDSFPIQTILRVWDSFLFEGGKVLFRYALAVFKINEEQLLKCEDHMAVFNYMRQVPEKLGDHHLLAQIAFQGLNPFPMQKIQAKRDYYQTIVRAELDELDRLRNDYVNSKSEDTEAFSDTDD